MRNLRDTVRTPYVIGYLINLSTNRSLKHATLKLHLLETLHSFRYLRGERSNIVEEGSHNNRRQIMNMRCCLPDDRVTRRQYA